MYVFSKWVLHSSAIATELEGLVAMRGSSVEKFISSCVEIRSLQGSEEQKVLSIKPKFTEPRAAITLFLQLSELAPNMLFHIIETALLGYEETEIYVEQAPERSGLDRSTTDPMTPDAVPAFIAWFQ